MGRGGQSGDQLLYGNDPAATAPPLAKNRPGSAISILATIESDDKVHAFAVDVGRVIGDLDDDQVRALAQCGWGGDYPADEVVRELEARGHAEVIALFEHGERTETGFECHIAENQAERWLKQARPALYQEPYG